MLPGFRFLFAAIVLSMSVLVFGLGAAALLRAAHEEFASNPSWRAPPEPVFAQPNDPPADAGHAAPRTAGGRECAGRPRQRDRSSRAGRQKQQRPPSPKCRPLWNRTDSAAVKMPEPAPVQTAKAEAPAEDNAPAPRGAHAPPETTATAEEAKSVDVAEAPAAGA